MQISLNWLKDYIDLSGFSVAEITTSLTSLGLEVEGVQEFCTLKGDILVGEIKECAKHPGADSLRITKVDTGNGELLTIVCGAPNARTGIKVAVATIGAVLPGDFKIKKSKIRGEESFGMLCSGKELGISADDAGILELSLDLKLGTSVIDHFALKDTVITLGITPNRGDCLGYIGVARDLAAKLNKPWREPESLDFKNLPAEPNVKVTIENADDCPRFVALHMAGVSPKSSPQWLLKRLEAAGLRPINLIVDATNYVMLEYGQPIHAYDERSVRGKHLSTRRARTGEMLTTLDGKKLELVPTDLVICDDHGPIGLAGIMGGQNSEVKDDTTNIIIEVASFSGPSIRKTAKRLTLHTDAAHRFERGTDIEALTKVAYRVAHVIAMGLTEGGHQTPKILAQATDLYPSPLRPTRIALRLSRLKKLSGLTLMKSQTAHEILGRLGFPLLDQKEERMVFEVPSFRRDIEREADLIEEICRVHGYDQIPTTLPMMEIKPLLEDPYIDFVEHAKIAVAEIGFHEIISFPFMASADLDAFLVPQAHPMRRAVGVKNPLADDQALMHTTTLINLVKAVRNNRRFGEKGGRFFEIANCFYQAGSPANGYLSHTAIQGRHIKGRAVDDLRPIERMTLGGILDQPFQEKSWDAPERAIDFYDAKGAVLDFLANLGVKGLRFHRENLRELGWLHPKRSAIFEAHGKVLGYVGELHPETAEYYELAIHELPLVFEIDLEAAFHASQIAASVASDTARFPPVTRDLAFVVAGDVTHEAFAAEIDLFQKRNLASFRLFDVYKGEGIPAGKKSMAYALSFQSSKRTLTDIEVEKEVELLKSWLKGKLDAELR